MRIKISCIIVICAHLLASNDVVAVLKIEYYLINITSLIIINLHETLCSNISEKTT